MKQNGKSDRMNKNDNIIIISNVSKMFGEATAVDDVSLSIKRGEFITLLGPSGCGKTTLLRMIAGFETPTKGSIMFEGKDITAIPPYKRSINTVFQKYALFPHLNVYNNIAFGLKLKKTETGTVTKKNGKTKPVFTKFTKAEIKEKITAALKLVGLNDYEERDVNSLSGGQQQRVAIARALVCEPQVLLLDEPLGALDLKMRKEMQNELMKMHKELGITFIYVTHDQSEAITMSDRIVVMKDGAVQQADTPKKVYDEPRNAFVADFIGESNIISGIMLADYKVKFCETVFECTDKGYEKSERVDIVIRPEDIYLMPADNEKAMLKGKVTSCIFKGTYYDINVDVGDYEFTAQGTQGYNLNDTVSLYVKPFDIHIMKKLRMVNEFITEVTAENEVEICGGYFECDTTGFEVGDTVKASIAFDKIELTDDEEEGVIGGNIASTLYKGKYYQVQVYTDDDNDFYLDTDVEWDIDDRVGIKIYKEDIKLEKFTRKGEEYEA